MSAKSSYGPPPLQGRPWQPVQPVEAPVNVVHPAHLAERFVARVDEDPTSPAVICGDQLWTYRDLRESAREIGRRLGAWGLGRRCLVALVVESGWAEVAAVLGVAFAGASYVSVDASSSPGIIKQTLARLGVDAVLSEPGICARLADVLPTRTLFIERKNRAAEMLPRSEGPLTLHAPEDPLWRELDQEEEARAEATGHVTAPSYLSYRAAGGLLNQMERRLELDGEDRLLALAPLGSRAGFCQVLATVLLGGALVIPQRAEAADPAQLLALIEDYEVTALVAEPPRLVALLEYLLARRMTWPGGRLALVTGDWLPVQLPELLRRFAPAAKLAVLREDHARTRRPDSFVVEHVVASWLTCTAPLTWSRESRGGDGPRLVVLNDALEACPPGVPGSLFLAGVEEVASWRQAPMVRARMMVSPSTGERLYRTGHIGRSTRAGTIEFAPPNDGVGPQATLAGRTTIVAPRQ